MQGFQDRNKVNEIPKVTLQLFIAGNVANHIVFGFLINDGSSCNVLYIDIFKKLGLQQQYMYPCKYTSLLVE